MFCNFLFGWLGRPWRCGGRLNVGTFVVMRIYTFSDKTSERGFNGKRRWRLMEKVL
jgi:hypothetical protein